jgi:dephospho-CoA kinase
MLKLLRIAITGGIASGKTSVSRVFQELGAYVVIADAIVHELLAHDTEICQQIARLLGPDVLVDGQLSRLAIADKVFKKPDALHDLEKVLHPAVLNKIEELFRSAATGTYSAFVVEFPLLFEIGQEKIFDITIAVDSDESLCKKRFIQKGFTEEEYERRMQRQLKPKAKMRQANYVIVNNGSLEDLRKQVREIYQHILNQKP